MRIASWGALALLAGCTVSPGADPPAVTSVVQLAGEVNGAVPLHVECRPGATLPSSETCGDEGMERVLVGLAESHYGFESLSLETPSSLVQPRLVAVEPRARDTSLTLSLGGGANEASGFLAPDGRIAFRMVGPLGSSYRIAGVTWPLSPQPREIRIPLLDVIGSTPTGSLIGPREISGELTSNETTESRLLLVRPDTSWGELVATFVRPSSTGNPIPRGTAPRTGARVLSVRAPDDQPHQARLNELEGSLNDVGYIAFVADAGAARFGRQCGPYPGGFTPWGTRSPDRYINSRLQDQRVSVRDAATGREVASETFRARSVRCPSTLGVGTVDLTGEVDQDTVTSWIERQRLPSVVISGASFEPPGSVASVLVEAAPIATIEDGDLRAEVWSDGGIRRLWTRWAGDWEPLLARNPEQWVHSWLASTEATSLTRCTGPAVLEPGAFPAIEAHASAGSDAQVELCGTRENGTEARVTVALRRESRGILLRQWGTGAPITTPPPMIQGFECTDSHHCGGLPTAFYEQSDGLGGTSYRFVRSTETQPSWLRLPAWLGAKLAPIVSTEVVCLLLGLAFGLAFGFVFYPSPAERKSNWNHEGLWLGIGMFWSVGLVFVFTMGAAPSVLESSLLWSYAPSGVRESTPIFGMLLVFVFSLAGVVLSHGRLPRRFGEVASFGAAIALTAIPLTYLAADSPGMLAGAFTLASHGGFHAVKRYRENRTIFLPAPGSDAFRRSLITRIRNATQLSHLRLVATDAQTQLTSSTNAAEETLLLVCAAASAPAAGAPTQLAQALDALPDPLLLGPDAPYAALAYALLGHSGPRAKRVLHAVFSSAPGAFRLEMSLRSEMQTRFPPDTAARTLGKDIVMAACTSRPDWAWAIDSTSGAIGREELDEDSVRDLVSIATRSPQVLVGKEDKAATAIAQTGQVSDLVAGIEASLGGHYGASIAKILGGVARFGYVLPERLVPGLRAVGERASGEDQLLVSWALLAARAPGYVVESVTRATQAGLPLSGELALVAAKASIAAGDVSALATLRAMPPEDLGDEAWVELHLAFDELPEALERAREVSAARSPWQAALVARVALAANRIFDVEEALDLIGAPSTERLLLVARLSIREDDLDAAQQVLETLVAEEPTWAEARYRLGCVHALKGDAHRSASELTQSHHERAAPLLGELARRRGEVDNARQALAVGLSRSGLGPRAMISIIELAIALRDADSARRGLSLLESVARLSNGTWGSTVARLRAATEELSGQLSIAREHYVQAQAWGRAGLLAMMERNDAAATEAFDRLSDADLVEESAAVLQALAVNAVGRGQLERADAALVHALEKQAGHAGIGDDLAKVRLARAAQLWADEGEAAFSALDELLATATELTGRAEVTALREEVALKAARVAVQSGKKAACERAMHTLMGLPDASTNPKVLLFAGALSLPLERTALVVGSLETLAGRGDPWAQYLFGLARWKAGEREDAVRWFEKASQTTQPDLAATAWLARAVAAGDEAAIEAAAGAAT